jgi:hypothetical protein
VTLVQVVQDARGEGNKVVVTHALPLLLTTKHKVGTATADRAGQQRARSSSPGRIKNFLHVEALSRVISGLGVKLTI